MVSVKAKRPVTGGHDAEPIGGMNSNQRDLLDRAGNGFEKFIQDTRQQNQRATEINARLRALGLEGITTREQFRDAVKVNMTKLSTEDGAKRFVELLALAKDFAALTPPIEEAPGAGPHAESVVVDSPSTKEEDQSMSATSDKDYIDSRLETIETRMDGRIATLESKIDGKFTGVDAKFAELRSDMHKGFADMTKWIVGTVLAVAAVSITIMTFVLNNAAPKAPTAAPAPIIVYAQPAPPAAQNPAPTASPAQK